MFVGAGPALAAPAPIGPAAAAAAAPVGRYSFDLTAVGVPTRTVSGAKEAGVVDVYFPDGRTQRLSQSNLGFGVSSYQRFGTSVVVRDLNNDGLSDLVVGAPGVASKGRTGQGYVLLQSVNGFTAAGAKALDNGNANAGDRFGAAIAVSRRASSDTMLDLWVGAPGRNVNGTKDAGAVFRFYVGADGGASFNDVISQETMEVGQSAKPGDQFGEVLAEQFNGVVVGVPHKDVGAGKDAGEVIFIRTNETTDLLMSAQTYSQNTKGIPGASATGDRFGASLAPLGIAVGAPGDDLGPIKDAGRIQLFAPASSGGGQVSPISSLTQDSPDLLGKAKAGNQWGASLTLGMFRCASVYQLAIGVPGTDVGKAKDAGAVIVQSLNGLLGNGCASKQLHQGKGGLLGGTAKAGDHLGQVVVTLAGDPADLNQKTDNLIIGVPGKNLGKAGNAGQAVVWNGKGKGVLKTFGYSGGNTKNQAYGSSFGIGDALPEMLPCAPGAPGGRPGGAPGTYSRSSGDQLTAIRGDQAGGRGRTVLP